MPDIHFIKHVSQCEYWFLPTVADVAITALDALCVVRMLAYSLDTRRKYKEEERVAWATCT